MAGSSREPEREEVAALLARRGRGDLRAASKLAPDTEIDDGVVGFHAQQAVEKSLKAALTAAGIEFPKTHDIDFLVALGRRHGIEVPDEVATGGWLTPWAAEFRYDDPPLDSLERAAAIEVAEAAAAWAEQLLAESTQ